MRVRARAQQNTVSTANVAEDQALVQAREMVAAQTARVRSLRVSLSKQRVCFDAGLVQRREELAKALELAELQDRADAFTAWARVAEMEERSEKLFTNARLHSSIRSCLQSCAEYPTSSTVESAEKETAALRAYTEQAKAHAVVLREIGKAAETIGDAKAASQIVNSATTAWTQLETELQHTAERVSVHRSRLQLEHDARQTQARLRAVITDVSSQRAVNDRTDCVQLCRDHAEIIASVEVYYNRAREHMEKAEQLVNSEGCGHLGALTAGTIAEVDQARAICTQRSAVLNAREVELELCEELDGLISRCERLTQQASSESLGGTVREVSQQIEEHGGLHRAALQLNTAATELAQRCSGAIVEHDGLVTESEITSRQRELQRVLALLDSQDQRRESQLKQCRQRAVFLAAATKLLSWIERESAEVAKTEEQRPSVLSTAAADALLQDFLARSKFIIATQDKVDATCQLGRAPEISADAEVQKAGEKVSQNYRNLCARVHSVERELRQWLEQWRELDAFLARVDVIKVWLERAISEYDTSINALSTVTDTAQARAQLQLHRQRGEELQVRLRKVSEINIEGEGLGVKGRPAHESVSAATSVLKECAQNVEQRWGVDEAVYVEHLELVELEHAADELESWAVRQKESLLQNDRIPGGASVDEVEELLAAYTDMTTSLAANNQKRDELEGRVESFIANQENKA